MDFNNLKNMSIGYTAVKKEDKNLDTKGIAIIGLNAQLGECASAEEFWQAIAEGRDLVRDFPQARWKTANEFSQKMLGRVLSEKIVQCAYLEHTDEFDAQIFNISPTEVELMDPVQKLFLESAWLAIEDAGYGGDSLYETSTGVFVGYSNTSRFSNTVLDTADENTYGIAVSGNVNSIIASRISHILNLKGPAMVIDTACSSSLVAIHLACKQIQTGEIDMAIAGGIRVMNVPPEVKGKRIGVESKGARTKTFDETADGTGRGEGVACVLLKSLDDALSDGDTIYAVIRGSSINQDGTSVGITAPNAKAQEEVILNAWKDAGVNPETISYIEAHGTATSLGDPVEITGIEHAFERYTKKKQFCGVGSVKSNIGHLDCAAGIAGLVKVVYMLRNKKIPPTIHFKSPNRNIDFINSPVYVSEELKEWKVETNPRRCGVSSFGISGTNCHMVLEEAPSMDSEQANRKEKRLLTISAKSKAAVQAMLESYQAFIRKQKEMNEDNFFFTANIGRGHYHCRLALVLDKLEDLLKLKHVEETCDSIESFYGEFRLVDDPGKVQTGYILSEEKERKTKEAERIVANIKEKGHNAETELARLYVQGADINFKELYSDKPYRRIPIPGYAFQRKRYVPKFNVDQRETSKANKKLHPLVDQCLVRSYGITIYEKKMNSIECWELREHKLNGIHVLPGTAFIEMAQYIGTELFNEAQFVIKDMIYLTPLSCMDDEERIVQIIVKQEEETIITIASKRDEEEKFLSHIEMKLEPLQFTGGYVEISDIQNRCKRVHLQNGVKNHEIVKVDGKHWDNVKEMYMGEKEVFLHFEIQEDLKEEAQEYFLYPSMLDPAINAGGYLLNSEYLPFSFEQGQFMKSLGEEFYSHIVCKDSLESEIARFDISLIGTDGTILGRIENYALKKVHESKSFMVSDQLKNKMFHELVWMKQRFEVQPELQRNTDACMVILRRHGDKTDALCERFRNTWKGEVLEVLPSQEMASILERLGEKKIGMIVHLEALEYKDNLNETIESQVEEVLGSLFHLVKETEGKGLTYQIPVEIITENAYQITGNETFINSMAAAVIAMGVGINEESNNLLFECVDVGETEPVDTIVDMVFSKNEKCSVAIRNREQYIPLVKELPYEEEKQEQELPITENGVYVITGGLGGMGVAFTRYLVKQEINCHILLWNRSYSEEEFLEKEFQLTDSYYSKQKVLKELMESGNSIHIVKGDVSDYCQTKELLDRVRKEYGNIRGIIHAAGVKGDGILIRKEWQDYKKVLQPKITGTWNLYQLTKDDNLDFYVMCSSYTAIFGAPGQSDYAAANAYMDSFAIKAQKEGRHMTAINWTGWSESGMAADNEVDPSGAYLDFVSDAEGSSILGYILKAGMSRVLVGRYNRSNFEQQREELEKKTAFSKQIVSGTESMKKGYVKEKSDNIEDYVITGKSMEDLTETEKRVIFAWGKTLGSKEIDVNDKFFDIGGNSLLATYLHKEIEKVYPGIMSITDLFVYSSVDEIATFIDKKTEGKKPKQVIEEDLNSTDIEDLVSQFVNGEFGLDKMQELLNETL